MKTFKMGNKLYITWKDYQTINTKATRENMWADIKGGQMSKIVHLHGVGECVAIEIGGVNNEL